MSAMTRSRAPTLSSRREVRFHGPSSLPNMTCAVSPTAALRAHVAGADERDAEDVLLERRRRGQAGEHATALARERRRARPVGRARVLDGDLGLVVVVLVLVEDIAPAGSALHRRDATNVRADMAKSGRWAVSLAQIDGRTSKRSDGRRASDCRRAEPAEADDCRRADMVGRLFQTRLRHERVKEVECGWSSRRSAVLQPVSDSLSEAVQAQSGHHRRLRAPSRDPRDGGIDSPALLAAARKAATGLSTSSLERLDGESL